MKLVSLSQLKQDITGKRVLVRVDFNVQVDKKNRVVENEFFRLEKVIPTIKWLTKRGAKVIVLTHRGRPHGKFVEKLSTKHIVKDFEKVLGKSITAIPGVIENFVHDSIKQMHAGEVALLENVRFYPGEEENDKKFAKKLSRLADFFVNDAFANSHRESASIVVIAKYLPSYAGFLIEAEIRELSSILEKPRRPFVVVLGGSKCHTKMPLIERLLPQVDAILVGGIVANTLLKSAHNNIGASVFEEDFVSIGKLFIKSEKVFLPNDVVCDNVNTKKIEAEVKNFDEIIKTDRIIDIGTKTTVEYANILRGAKTILWNGPLGWIEKRQGSHASEALAEYVAALSTSSKVKSVVGGGETLSILSRLNLLDDVTFVSTGGGAMLEYLVHNSLPGINPYIKK